MAFFIKDNHIFLNNIDSYCSSMLGHRSFSSPNYLDVKVWIRATVLFPSIIYLTGTNLCVHVKIFPGVVMYQAKGLPS